MLQLNVFSQFPAGEVFASGTIENAPSGLYMTRHEPPTKLLRWVATKGYANDWTIYCHWAEHSFDWIAKYGDKVFTYENVQICVPCTDEVLQRYRR